MRIHNIYILHLDLLCVPIKTVLLVMRMVDTYILHNVMHCNPSGLAVTRPLLSLIKVCVFLWCQRLHVFQMFILPQTSIQAPRRPL